MATILYYRPSHSVAALLMLLLFGRNTCTAEDADVSALIPCNGVTFPPENTRVCYTTSVDDPFVPTNCDATAIDRTNQTVDFIPQNPPPGDLTPLQTKIWSPGNLRGRNYQNNRLCRYNVACPPGFLLHYGWLNGSFTLEDEHNVDGCLDYLLIENFDQDNSVLCNTQGRFSGRRAAPLRAEFRSNTGSRHPGFQMDIICVSPEFQDLPGCRELPDPEARKKRNEKEPPFVPRTGNTLHVPREAFIEYRNNVLKIVFEDDILRVFVGIRKVIFWTGFRGAKGFRHSAPTHTIYGGGVLRLINSIAYYSTVLIPPSFEPNGKELQAIARLLHATRPFFVEQDIIDEDEPTTTEKPPRTEPTRPPTRPTWLPTKPTRPPTKPTKPTIPPTKPTDKPTVYPPTATRPTFRPIIRPYVPTEIYPILGKLTRRRRGEGSGLLGGSGGSGSGGSGSGYNDPRVDEDTVDMAEEYQDACNVFLRESALSYLLILEEMGVTH